ncbi:MAG: hypothetical protein HY049_01700 [Acidobacteria bacterium]|nr:hypothetical protein [Acidobacteriota bacterium]
MTTSPYSRPHGRQIASARLELTRVRRAMILLARCGLVAALGITAAAPASAACRKPGGFAIFQCSDRGYFEPPPEGTSQITALFWQVGFGNAVVNNGDGTGGAGIAPLGVFSGNDNGLWRVPLADARTALGDARVPEGSVCLASANWIDRGVDGCCDNMRDPEMLSAMDGFLNPLFDPRLLQKTGDLAPAPERLQDYPMAILLRDESSAWFAVAAVATAPRTGLGDIRQGAFSFGGIIDGNPNPVTSTRNAVPWQRSPAATLSVAGPGGEPDSWRVGATWGAVTIATDGSRIPSQAHALDNPGKGVGVADMGPLVAYDIQTAHLSDALIDEAGYPIGAALVWDTIATVTETRAEVEVPEDTCLRVAAHFGKVPGTRSVSLAECAVGHCGDVGYVVPGPAQCLEGPALKGSAARRRSGG